jgi:hypothetical protein
MQPQGQFRKGFVVADYLTRTFRVSGEVALQGTPLIDQLNDLNAQFITLERMFISPLLDPAVLTGNFKTGEIRKDHIGLVILTQRRDGLPLREGRYVGRNHVEKSILLVAAGFEIRGNISVHNSVNVPHFLRTTPEDFVLLFDTYATFTAKRAVVYKGDAVLVNRRMIEVFAMDESDKDKND